MIPLDQIKEYMQIVGNDGLHVGVIVRVEVDEIKLAKNDARGGPQHYPPLANVEYVERPRPSQPKQHSRDGEVALTSDSDQIRLRWNLQQAHPRLSAGRLTSNRSDRRGQFLQKKRRLVLTTQSADCPLLDVSHARNR